MMPNLLSTLRSLANAFLGRTGKPDRAGTATSMAMDADFSYRDKPSAPEREPAGKVDPIDELMRIVAEQAAGTSKGRHHFRLLVFLLVFGNLALKNINCY